jgi:uncharacterized protein (UPF0332 family)
VTTGITSEALLSVADTLTRTKDDSTTVHLRRAVSSAYYALFHGLIAEATRREVGVDPTREHDRHVLSRWYGHGEMRTVSNWVIRRADRRPVPEGVDDLLDHPPPDLVRVAMSFVELQQARHDADYDHRADPDADDAMDAIRSAQAALERLGGLAGERVYGNYLLLMGAARRVGR